MVQMIRVSVMAKYNLASDSPHIQFFFLFIETSCYFLYIGSSSLLKFDQ